MRISYSELILLLKTLLLGTLPSLDSLPTSNLFYPQPTNFVGQNSAEFSTNSNISPNNSSAFLPLPSGASAKKAIPNDEYGSHLAYPNSGYGNYNNDQQLSPRDSSLSADLSTGLSAGSPEIATPEEIESSYKTSLIHLKSSHGQSHPDFIPQSSFLDLLATPKPESQPRPSYESVLQPHLPQMPTNPGHSQFAEVYATSLPHPTLVPNNVHSFPGPFKGVVDNVPISLQQQALAQFQGHQGLVQTPPDFSVNVHYPPKITISENFPPQSGGSLGRGPHLKADFHPSEPDLSTFPQIPQPHPQLTGFQPSPMSSGFRPSFGPLGHGPGLGSSLNKVPHLDHHLDQIVHSQPQPHPPNLFGHHNQPNLHPNPFQSYHQLHQEFSLPGAIPTSPDFHYTRESIHPGLEWYRNNFHILKDPFPPKEETGPILHEDGMAAYLHFLAKQGGSGHNFHANPLPTSIYDALSQDSEESPSNRVNPSPTPNSFDILFQKGPSVGERRKNRKLKRRKNKGATRHRRKNKKKTHLKNVRIALNPSFKGKILPHHWDQLAAQLLPKLVNKAKKGPSSRKTENDPVRHHLSMLRKAYGIDPNVFGELGTQTEKFTRSTAPKSNATKNDGDGDQSSSEEEKVSEEEPNQESSEEERISKEKIKRKRKLPRKSKSKPRNKNNSKGFKEGKKILMSGSSTTTTTSKPTTTMATTPTPTTKTTTTMASTTTTTIPSTTPSSTPVSSTTTTPTTVPTLPTTTTKATTPKTTSSPSTTTTISPTTTPEPSTTAPTTPKTNITSSTSSQESVHFTISVLSSPPSKKYDTEATSESRRLHQNLTTEETSPKNEEQSSSEEYGDSEESEELDSTSSSSSIEDAKSHLETNGHQKIPLQIADDVADDILPHRHELIPLYFESTKMRDTFSTGEYDDMMLASGHKKKDLSSDMGKGENSEESSGRSKRKKIKPSLARRLIQGGSGSGGKRVQKVKKPKHRRYSKDEASDKNTI